jgi:hypothetical protein
LDPTAGFLTKYGDLDNPDSHGDLSSKGSKEMKGLPIPRPDSRKNQRWEYTFSFLRNIINGISI